MAAIMSCMNWATIGTVVAGVAAVATLIVTIASQASASFRYDLWVKVLNNARNEHQREIAADRVDYYFVELAVAELTRRRRTQFVAVGFGTAFISLIAIVLGTALARVDGTFAYWAGWAIVVLGWLGYVGGLALAAWAPDRVRDQQRARTTEASAAAALKQLPPRRWWQRRNKVG
jgi:hypothetical protein